MAKKVGTYPIPFDKSGNQMHYPDPWFGEPDWRANLPFEDTLVFQGFTRGRSAAYFQFKRVDGTTVCMFLKEMEELIPHMIKGVATGVFQFVKRGQNYGCTLIRPVAPDWAECQRVSDLPEVDEVLRGFSDDPTGDNATCLVRAIYGATAKVAESAPGSGS